MSDGGEEFEDFVVGRGPALLRFAFLLSGDRLQAEDLVQEALVKAHRRWGHIQRADRLEAYVRRIVVNDLTSWRRRRSASEIVGPVPDAAYADAADLLADRDLMWRALADLPRRQRAVLVLRYYEHLPDAEIADQLGAREGTVRSLASRAFATLRRHPDLAHAALDREETR